MVTEFTELQGIVGREYARLDGCCEGVAVAIDEHYMPRFAGDGLPQTTAGRIVSLADKIDTIVGTFSRGKIPTGSQDPFALRRQALGLVNTVIEARWKISLSAIVAKAMDQYGITDAAQRDKLQGEVADFIRLRLKNVLETDGVRYDIIDAVLGDVDDIYAVSLKAEALVAFVGEADATNYIQAFVRAANIAAKAETDAIDAQLFTEPAEEALYEAYTAAAASVSNLAANNEYAGVIAALETLAQPIDEFFNAVMVMDKNEQIRANRLGLMKSIQELEQTAADFTKLVI